MQVLLGRHPGQLKTTILPQLIVILLLFFLKGAAGGQGVLPDPPRRTLRRPRDPLRLGQHAHAPRSKEWLRESPSRSLLTARNNSCQLQAKQLHCKTWHLMATAVVSAHLWSPVKTKPHEYDAFWIFTTPRILQRHESGRVVWNAVAKKLRRATGGLQLQRRCEEPKALGKVMLFFLEPEGPEFSLRALLRNTVFLLNYADEVFSHLHSQRLN